MDALPNDDDPIFCVYFCIIFNIVKKGPEKRIRIDRFFWYRKELQNLADKIDFHHGGRKEAPHEKLDRHQKLEDRLQQSPEQVDLSVSACSKLVCIVECFF